MMLACAVLCQTFGWSVVILSLIVKLSVKSYKLPTLKMMLELGVSGLQSCSLVLPPYVFKHVDKTGKHFYHLE